MRGYSNQYLQVLGLLTIIALVVPPFASAGTFYEADIIVYRSYLGGNFKESVVEVIADSQGNSYVFGYTDSEEYKYIQPINSFIGALDIFIAKVNSLGALLFYVLIGGRMNEILTDVCQMDDGSFLLTGYSNSDNLPITDDAFQRSRSGDEDCFIIEISNEGDVEYCTYFGGDQDDRSLAISYDNAGSIIICGQTSSNNFPLMNSSRLSIEGESDFFLAKFSESMQSLNYSTFWGSNSIDYMMTTGNLILIDEMDNVYVASSTESHLYPSSRTKTNVTSDAYIAKFDLNGSLIDHYFLNASLDNNEDSYITSMAMSENDEIYVTGTIHRNSWITPQGAVDPVRAIDIDIFVGKVNSDFTTRDLVYLEGFRNDTSIDLQLNDTGCVIIAGITESLNFPTTDGSFEFLGAVDAFFTILTPNLQEIDFSTFLGGYDTENSSHIAIDSLNRIVMVGTTNSIDIIPINAFQDSKNSPGYDFDGYVSCLDMTLMIPIPEPPNYRSIYLALIVICPPLLGMFVLLAVRRRIRKVDSYRSQI